MSESEPVQVGLKQGEEYIVHTAIFNATVLRPAPSATHGKTWNWDVGNIDLEEGDKVSFVGIASELKLFGDTAPENLVFKPSREVKKRYDFISKKDLLAINPAMIDKFGEK